MNTRRPIPWTLALLLIAAAPAVSAQLRFPQGGGAPPPASPGAPGFAAPASPFAPAPAPAATPAARPGEPRLVDRVVAVVNAEAITEVELEQRTRAVLARLRGQNVQLPPESELQRQILERMITERAALHAAREAGVRIDDAAIDRAIGRIAQERKLSVAQLRQRLEGEGTAFSTFRAELASEMAIGRMREREIESKVQVSEAEIDAYLAEQGGGGPGEINLAQLLVSVPEGASAEVVERARQRAESLAGEARGGVELARLLAAASGGPDRVEGGVIGMRPVDRLPPVFVQAVESLRPGEIAPVIRSPAGFHVIQLLERRDGGALAKLAATPVRQTRARHILVRVNELNPESEVIRRLTEIRERIEAKTVTFAEMARQYSVDGSASIGGDIGWVYPGDTVPEFERAMDALEPGRIAGPVQSPFGYHLIQVDERRTDGASTERIRAAARSAIRERKAAEAYQEWIAQVRDRAYVQVRLDDR
ncbi:MAG TPA: peptidylprolyl isomerase [Burkholderiaceae bacterium]|mgnify:FL=1|nr:peptidylprolyl isomerase [Burkholderiaceae bacterium]